MYFWKMHRIQTQVTFISLSLLLYNRGFNFASLHCVGIALQSVIDLIFQTFQLWKAQASEFCNAQTLFFGSHAIDFSDQLHFQHGYNVSFRHVSVLHCLPHFLRDLIPTKTIFIFIFTVKRSDIRNNVTNLLLAALTGLTLLPGVYIALLVRFDGKIKIKCLRVTWLFSHNLTILTFYITVIFLFMVDGKDHKPFRSKRLLRCYVLHIPHACFLGSWILWHCIYLYTANVLYGVLDGIDTYYLFSGSPHII